MHLEVRLEIARGNSTAAKITFSNAVMVRVVMHSLKDGVAAPAGNNVRNALRITQKCAALESAAVIIAARALVGAISLALGVGPAADKVLDLDAVLKVVSSSRRNWLR